MGLDSSGYGSILPSKKMRLNKGDSPEWRSVKEIKEEGLPSPIGVLAITTIGKETKLCVSDNGPIGDHNGGEPV